MAFAAVLFVIFVLGLLWLAGAQEQAAAGGTFGFMALLAFTAGLSMIVLPCTLPLVFIIVPLSAGKDYKKGFFMALLFGLGLTITISLYGVAMAYVGQIFGISAATPWLLVIAGVAAYLFGLSELGIFHLRLPFAANIMPRSLQQKGDYTKSLFLGLLRWHRLPQPAFLCTPFLYRRHRRCRSRCIAWLHSRSWTRAAGDSPDRSRNVRFVRNKSAF